ncbi:hypothetical protein [Caulobacter zeae]|uniref:hypothetical protein n=1 Tax=Caulobacter zeae TaxID=2055137 RepID=UPI0010552FD6|nr:hypothetical protein [Caulobacter zeae]
MVTLAMNLTRISVIALGLALSSCSDGGFNGRTQQFSGVWLHEFEGSTFVDGATKVPTERPDPRKTDYLEWRDWPRLEALMETSRGNGNCYTVQPFLVTFSGRRTHYPLYSEKRLGGAGHLGLWRSKVTVQRPISAKRLGPSFCYER